LPNQPSLHRVLVDVAYVMSEILGISNTMVSEPPLPDFTRSKGKSKGTGISAFDSLHYLLQGDVRPRRNKQVNMLGHHHNACSR
jgi:hypothetical protein